MQKLSRRQVSIVQALYSRHGRKKLNLSICEGLKVCKELEKRNKELISFAVCQEGFDEDLLETELITLSKSEFSKISSSVNSQGVIFIIERPEIATEFESLNDSFSILLDKISDPGNFGTIIRTAKSIGLSQLFYTKGSVDPFSDKVIRSAIGAQFSLQLIELRDVQTAIEMFMNNGRKAVYRTDPHKGVSCFTSQELFENSVIIFGSESSGLNEIEGTMDVTIPMPGKFESVNLAQAATVIMFEYVRRLEIK